MLGVAPPATFLSRLVFTPHQHHEGLSRDVRETGITGQEGRMKHRLGDPSPPNARPAFEGDEAAASLLRGEKAVAGRKVSEWRGEGKGRGPSQGAHSKGFYPSTQGARPLRENRPFTKRLGNLVHTVCVSPSDNGAGLQTPDAKGN